MESATTTRTSNVEYYLARPFPFKSFSLPLMPTRNLILLGTISTCNMFAAASAFATASSRHYMYMHYSRPASFSTQSHLLLGKGRSRPRSSSGAATFSSLRLSSAPFQVTSKFEPSGDQPKAIEDLVRGIQEGERFSVLRGATGTGKTFVMGHTVVMS